MSLHLDHFGLSVEPFSKDIADQELWLPPSKRSLLDELIDAVEAKESVVLTGEPGARENLPASCSAPCDAPRALPALVLPQRDARPARLLSPTLPRARLGAERHRRRRVLCRELPHRGPRSGAPTPDLPTRRSAPTPPGHARSSAHPAQLRVGLEAATIPRPRWPQRLRRTPQASP
jgi:hypothetical protein